MPWAIGGGMLTDTKIRKVKATDKQQKLSDAKGLYLLVKPNGSKLWQMAYRFNGKQKTLSIGAYPDVSLARARLHRDEAKILLADDIDPSEQKKIEKKKTTTSTFSLLAQEWIENKRDWSENTRKNIESRLKNHIYPVIGNKPIDAINRQHIRTRHPIIYPSR